MRNPIIDVVEAHTSNFPTHDELAHHLESERGYSKDQMEYDHLRTDFDGEPDLEMLAVIVHERPYISSAPYVNGTIPNLVGQP